jgi:hypothetical protein
MKVHVVGACDDYKPAVVTIRRLGHPRSTKATGFSSRLTINTPGTVAVPGGDKLQRANYLNGRNP